MLEIEKTSVMVELDVRLTSNERYNFHVIVTEPLGTEARLCSISTFDKIQGILSLMA